jgi:hypothetical protein
MLFSTGTADLQLMANDHPAPFNATHIGVISAPESESTLVVDEKMQCLNVGAGAGMVPINGSELRAKQVLAGRVFFQCAPNITHKTVAAPVNFRAKVNGFDIVSKASRIACPIPFIDAGSVVKHKVLQLNAVASISMGHKSKSFISKLAQYTIAAILSSARCG